MEITTLTETGLPTIAEGVRSHTEITTDREDTENILKDSDRRYRHSMDMDI